MSSGGATVSLDLSVSEDILPSLPEEPTYSSEWMAYLEYIDGMVLDKLTQAVQSSVGVFFEETNPDKALDESRPLFEVNLELKDPDIVFNPSLDDEARKGFYRLVEGLLYDVVHMSELIPRVATHNPRPHYR
ncbi:dynein beta chain, ciliary-like, partial [Frankliniella occidentalis]|uniref:Dynein beta chain, ciliary-like n=1 Tax=Frankliniella occidentalis TaxID=133901 RepID=A0A9C6XV01_FRAOC